MPFMQKPITKSFRYQKYLKSVSQDINKIKLKFIDETFNNQIKLNNFKNKWLQV